MISPKFAQAFRLPPNANFRFATAPTDVKAPFDSKSEGRKFVAACIQKIRDLQYRLFVEQKQSLLIVLQAPDAAGKDGVIRKVLGRMNTQGCSVHPFKVPTELEASHDFLWRVHQHAPSAGRVAIFNRSHYEDVLAVRVLKLAPRAIWRRRYNHINAFESLLADSGTRIIKLYLNISRREQLDRFKARLDHPEKHWKLNTGDYAARDSAEAYRDAYEEVFARCNPEHAPWYVIPSDHKWFRDCTVAAILLATLESMDPQLPKVDVDLDEIRKLYEQELGDV